MFKYLIFAGWLLTAIIFLAGCGGLGGGSGVSTVGNTAPAPPVAATTPEQPGELTPGPSGTPSVLGGDNKYVVYKSSEHSTMAVLGAAVPPPEGYTPDSSVKIFMIDPGGLAVDLPVEGNGAFNLDNINTGMKDTVDINVIDITSGEGIFIQLPVLDTGSTSSTPSLPDNSSPVPSPATIPVSDANQPVDPNTDPNAVKPSNTALPSVSSLATNLSSEKIVHIKIFPDVKTVLTGEIVFYRAVGIDANGKKVKPASIKWSKNMKPVSGDPSTAIFNPSTTDDRVEITAWMPDEHDPDDQDKALHRDVAIATVLEGTKMTEVTGTICDTDGTAPVAGSLLICDTFSPGVDYIPLKKVCLSGNDGKYKIHLIPGLKYNVSFINPSDKKFYKGNPDNINPSENQEEMTQIVNRTPTVYTYDKSFKPLLPVEDYIQNAWNFVTNVTDKPAPGLYMDISHIVNTPGEEKEGKVMTGEFSRGTYELTKNNENTWDISLINYQNHRKARITYDNTKYKGELSFNPFSITDEKYSSDTVCIRQDEWNITDNNYKGTSKYYSSGQKDKLLYTSDFDWKINDDSSVEQTVDLWFPDRVKKMGTVSVIRHSPETAIHDSDNLLYSFTGSMEIYLYESGNHNAIGKTINWEIKDGYINRDMTGKFDMSDVTRDSQYKGTRVVINLQREKQGKINDEQIGSGELYPYGSNNPSATFKIYANGLIDIKNSIKGTKVKFTL
ncbi:MAG: hypothetical protein ABRQ38_28020 [Candidatus Eremiobacterota bacterium]